MQSLSQRESQASLLREHMAGRLELSTFGGVDLRIGEAEFFERLYDGG